MKFSLRTLLIAALVISIASALLASRSEFAVWLVELTYRLSLIGALIALVYTNGAVRAFWIGYAIAGWAQLWLDFGNLLSMHSFRVHEFFYGGMPFPNEGDNRVNQDYADVARRFASTLVSLKSIAIALAGGCLAMFLYRRRERDRSAQEKQ